MSNHADMSRDDLIDQAAQLDESIYAYPEDERVLFACETFYGHGFADDDLGQADGFGHYYRVHRWIVLTDSQGFNYLSEAGTEDEAKAEWATIEAEYAEVEDGDER